MGEQEVDRWIGKLERGGIPVPPRRPDAPSARHWSWPAIAATERPRQPVLSPDGTALAFWWDRGETSDLWSLPVDGGEPRRLTTGRAPAPYWEDDSPAWSPDGTRLAYADAGAVWVVLAAGGLPDKLGAGSAPVWLDDARLVVGVERAEATALAVMTVEDPWPTRLAARPVRTAEPDGSDAGRAAQPGDRIEAITSPDGRLVALTFWPLADLNRSEIRVVDPSTGLERTLTGTAGMHDGGPAWSPDSATIAYRSEAPGWYEVFLVAVAGGASRQLTADGADFADLAWSPDGTRLAASRGRRGVADLVSIDATTGAVAVIAAGGWWSSPAWLADGSLVATHESATVAPRLVRIDPHRAITDLLRPTPAAIRVAPHARPEWITYTAPDGLEIPALLYRPDPAALPPGRDGSRRPGPAIVYPHGGPTSLTGDEWFPLAQYFVAKGYTWLAPNFRGSTSYGRDFERANHGAWGVADTLDCLAGFDWLAAQPAIDPARMAIFGASYGSYLALSAVVDDPQHRFACAVAKYGDCDIATSWALGDRGGRLDQERTMGRPAERPAAFRAGSPIHRLHNLTVPILVAHGEQDERVHPAQSEELVEALRRLGKTYEYVTYPSEGHGLLRTGPFLDFHHRLERFLDWYLM